MLSTSIPFVDGLREEIGVADKTISGLGDISVTLRWSPWTERSSSLKGLSFQAGLILPTGDPADQPLVGVANPSVFQLGTGTTQLSLGGDYVWTQEDWTYRFDWKTTFPLDENSQGFKPAPMVYGSLSAGRPVHEDLNFSIGVNVTYLEDDQFHGRDLVTGYTAIAAKFGAVWNVSEDVAISGSVSIPVYRDVNQTQIAAGPIFQMGLSRSF